ncbi:hypothetical protein OS493_011435 [Desmophyllum pertusum]|uniref:Uncharacterized protein n=1 Tax=Desmophyllum pertusum TaxID=174260 RepID=A0A9X0CKX6_9CNID|nr:hypothetical protein OS493_011435 [Desmophyllum pertusum]
MEQNAKEEGVIMSLSCYETAFHKFVNAHEAYSPFEDGKNEEALAEESYENVKESKYLLDIDINKWTSLASSKCSGREKRRILEEAKLKIDVLEEKQYLERRMEEEEAELKKKELQIEEERLKRKAEWSRKMEMLEVELEMKKATMDRIL